MAFGDDVRQAVVDGAKAASEASSSEGQGQATVFEVPGADVTSVVPGATQDGASTPGATQDDASTPDATQDDVSSPDVTQDGAAAPQDGAAAPQDGESKSKFTKELQQLSEAYGVPSNDFSTETDLRAAIRFAAAQIVKQGQQNPYANGVPQPDGTPDDSQPEKGIDLSSLDPAVAKHIKDLTNQNAQSEARLQEVEQQAEVAQRDRLTDGWRKVAQTTVDVMDSFATPELGVGQNVTFAQQSRREAVFGTIAQIINGFLQSGRAPQDVPNLNAIATMAMDLHDIKKVESAGGNKASMQGKPSSDSASRVVKVLDNAIRPHDTLGLMKDPSYLQGLNAIFAKR